MKRFLLLAALVVLLAPGAALAEKEGSGKEGTTKEKSVNPEATFEKVKARKVEDLKALLACSEAAQNREALKGCREQVSKKHEMQDKQEKLQRIQERKKRLDEQEKKLRGEVGK
ncbi:MAG: hypothetical protein HQL87_06410 [Magnetococcales bacterium]|nr:hypothetical protein [Magnetococcales bacterium]